MGGRILEFEYVNQRTNEVLFRLCWESDAPPRNAAEWQFRYSVPGADGIRANLVASGNSGGNVNGRRLVDLFRVFDKFCRRWFEINPAAFPENVNIVPGLDIPQQGQIAPPRRAIPLELCEPRKAA
jgi:hypothetical protein